jgi:4-amino-4-deoxy-L-arabinose transferase-like glycosyltransferase
MRTILFKTALKERSSSALIFCILLVAFLLRILTLLRNDPVAFDSALYFEMAAFMRAGNWPASLAYPYPPLFPLLIAGLQEVGLSAEIAGLLLAAACNLLVLFLLVAITRRIAGERAALGAAFLWAIQPYAVRLGTRALSDAPTAFFVAVSVWSGLLALERRKITWAIGAGAASGLAYLARPEGIEPALALTALYLFKSAGRLHRRVAWVAAPLVGWAIVASPYVVYLSMEAGSLTLSKKKSPAAMLRSVISSDAPNVTTETASTLTKTPEQSQPETKPQENPSAEQSAPHSLERPHDFGLGRILRDIYIFQQPLVNGIHPIVLLFAAFAPWSLWERKDNTDSCATALLISLLALHLAVLVGVASSLSPSYLGGHHFLLMLLYLLPFAGAGLAGTFGWLQRRIPNLRQLPAGMLTLATLITIPSSVLRSPERGAILREGGIWIRDHSSSQPVVLTDAAKLTYHAGAQRVPLQGDLSKAVSLARGRGAQWIAFYSDGIHEISQALQPELASKSLALATEFSERSGKRVYYLRIYRLRKTT